MRMVLAPKSIVQSGEGAAGVDPARVNGRSMARRDDAHSAPFNPKALAQLVPLVHAQLQQGLADVSKAEEQESNGGHLPGHKPQATSLKPNSAFSTQHSESDPSRKLQAHQIAGTSIHDSLITALWATRH